MSEYQKPVLNFLDSNGKKITDISADMLQKIFLQGLSFHCSGHLLEAEAMYQQVLQCDSRHTDAMTNLGTIYIQRGAFAKGEELLLSSLAINPEQVNALNNCIVICRAQHRLQEALDFCDRALALQPYYVDAHNNRGLVLYDLGRIEEAIACYDAALACNPTHWETMNNRGNALTKLRRLDEAMDTFKAILQLDPANAVVLSNLGNTLREMGRYEEAIVQFQAAVALQPDYQDAWNNMGLSCYCLGQFDQAMQHYNHAISLDMAKADSVLWNQSFLYLLRGDFEPGWRLYEFRFSMQMVTRREFEQPKWSGEQDLSGKTILLYAEQGYGDTLQFCRYANLVAKLAEHVILEAYEPLIPVLETLQESVTLVRQGIPLPHIDYHASLLSLPLAFKTRVETIPAQIPYLFVPENRQDQWCRLDLHRLHVGLVWSGTTSHNWDTQRSMALRLWAPLFELPCTFHALQKEIREQDLVDTVRFANLQLHHTELEDFADTAALIDRLDLVICVDTSVAHLAGAMGKKLWVLLAFVPDFRWMLDREDSPWYPTARLFRQQKIGDWQGVIEQVVSAAKAWLAQITH